MKLTLDQKLSAIRFDINREHCSLRTNNGWTDADIKTARMGFERLDNNSITADELEILIDSLPIND